MIWDVWKQGFAAWEQATTQYMEKVLQNPGVLGPAGAMLTAAMKTKVATDRALAAWWSAFGLPTRRDQERALHKLNQLESRLYDLEEQLLGRAERGRPVDSDLMKSARQAGFDPTSCTVRRTESVPQSAARAVSDPTSCTAKRADSDPPN